MTKAFPKRSPWGRVQHAEELAPGVVAVSTAGHGGLKLDRKMNLLIPPIFRKPGGFYEEDCEANIPFHFLRVLRDGKTPEQLAAVLKGLKTWFWEDYEEYFQVVLAPGESFLKDQDVWEESHKDRFVVTSALFSKDDRTRVWVKAVRQADGAVGWFTVPAAEYKDRDVGFAVDEARHARSDAPLF